MDAFMEFYFEEVFVKMERDFLNERYKRRELVQYFNTVIAGCAKGEGTTDEATCRNFVRSILRHHSIWKTNNGNVCLMGKYHNLLYVAIKLAFDWSLQSNGTVASLLDELYACEKTFERIFLGAIFGTSAPHFLAGWKSDFKDKEENVHALVFYLDHATNANLEYQDGNKTHRFIDVPLESCGMAPPIRVVIQMGAAEMLMILLRFGARITPDPASTNAVESVLDRMNNYNRKYPYELVTCLKLILRATPRLVFTVDVREYQGSLPEIRFSEDYNYQKGIALLKYGDIIQDNLIPPTRCSINPVELKHLSRCAVRHRLWENFQLPFGIQKLRVPNNIKRYLDLMED